MRLIRVALWLIISLLCARTSGMAQRTADPVIMSQPLTKRLIDSIERVLNRFYIFPDKAALMSKQLQTQFKQGQYRTITNPNKLATQLGQELQSVYADGHMFVRYDPDFARELTEIDPNRRRIEDSLALVDAVDENFGLNKVEILDGNIGYLPVYNFTTFTERARPSFVSALRFLSQTRALIIDMRYNGGGSPEMVSQLGSYFFSVRTPFTTIENRVRDSTFVYWADPVKADGLYLSMPVYILTSHSTFSAAEDFSYSMQQAKRALIVGDTTGGGAHPARPFQLGQGFLINLPFAQSINPYSKTNWESIGVLPDIPTQSTSALEKAQELILTTAMEQTSNEGQKRKLQWAVHELKSRQQQFVVAADALAQYIGDYDGLLIYLKNNKLWCKNMGRGNEITSLNPIIEDWFTLNEQVHFQFIKGPAGQMSGLKMHWRDGRETPVDKIGNQDQQNRPVSINQKTQLPGLKDWFLATGDWQNSPQLYIREFGIGQDTIIMLHGGWGGDHSDFLEAVRPLEEHYHFIFYDQRGSLRSPFPDSLITFAHHIEDLELLRKELKLEKISIIGHSMGAVLASAYATKYPRRVRQLALLAPAYLKYPPSKEDEELQQKGFNAGKAFINRHEVAQELNKYELNEDPPNLSSREQTSKFRINFAKRMLFDVGKWPLMMGGRALYKDRVFQLTENSYPKSGWDYIQEFKKQSYPVSIIVGDHDFLDFDNLLLKKWLIGSTRIKLSIIEKAGHVLWLDQPEKFANELVIHLSNQK
jgi:pimeloyl-ACP methyl ester carboxylesterase